MRRRPLLAKHVTGASQKDYLRNYWCPYYTICIKEAITQNKYLSCSLCRYKRSRISNATFA